MRIRLRRTPKDPRGSAIMLFGLMLPMFVGFAALSVDSGVLAVARAQLSTVADAAALAGATQLADDYFRIGITNLSNANDKAATIGQYNLVLGQAAVITQNPGNASGVGDIMVGYIDPTNTQSTLDSSAASASIFNSVQVTAQRSSDHGGLVPIFFAKVWPGVTDTAVSVQSTATVFTYSIKGIQGDGSSNVPLLPIVLAKSTYTAMIAGPTQAQDQYTWNPATKTVTSGPDGVAESVLYPVGGVPPVNCGTIKVGVPDISPSTQGAQIQYGITPAQMATYNSAIQLNSSLTPPSVTFDGNLGIDAALEPNIKVIITNGQPVTIPIYDDTNGNNPPYRVVAFAPVHVLDSNFASNYVIVQPALVKNSPAIPGTPYVPGTPYPSWKSGGLVEVHISQ
jgi:Flp pilus assembly protein TadG